MSRRFQILALVLLGAALSGCSFTNTAETDRHFVRGVTPVYEGARVVAHSDDHWTEVGSCRLCGSLDYEVKSSLWGFIDDVSIVVRADGAGGSFLHMRSASRTGKSDFGANDARIRKFLDELQKLLVAHPD
jgi:uncharacterized protein (DUF1499 family)